MPEPSTGVVPTTAPSTVTVTTAPGSAVPVTVGVLSAETDPSAGEVTTGAGGALASTVKPLVAEAGETFPAPSVAVASKFSVQATPLPPEISISAVPAGSSNFHSSSGVSAARTRVAAASSPTKPRAGRFMLGGGRCRAWNFSAPSPADRVAREAETGQHEQRGGRGLRHDINHEAAGAEVGLFAIAEVEGVFQADVVEIG